MIDVAAFAAPHVLQAGGNTRQQEGLVHAAGPGARRVIGLRAGGPALRCDDLAGTKPTQER